MSKTKKITATIKGADEELAELLSKYKYVGKTQISTTGKPRRLTLRLVEDLPAVKLTVA